MVKTRQRKTERHYNLISESKKSPGHESLNRTDEDDEEETQMVQLYVGVGEGVTEGGVDDHEQNDAAHRPERRFPAVQTLS